LFYVLICNLIYNGKGREYLNKLRIKLPRTELEAFCRKYHIVRLSLFGSVLRPDFGADSDVDILVQFETGHVPGFIKLAGMELELGRMLRRKVDLRTAEDLSPYFRDDVLKQAKVEYATK
jgi:predicted nucleotidyltransferase